MQTITKTSALFLGALATVSTVHASADYGPAIWRPTCNANYYTTGSGHKFHVIHDMEGYYASTISLFTSCGYTSASVHYAANGKHDTSTDYPAGEITQMVTDAHYAWHVRCWNQYCTGTEHEGFASNPAWYTEAMYQASAGVTAHECAKYNYPKDRNHVVGHNEWQNAGWRSYAGSAFGIDTTCNSHTDPGAFWDWSHYMTLVGGGASGIKDHVEVFARSSSGTLLQHSYANGSGWGPWIDLGGNIAGGVGVGARNSSEVLVFARGATLNNLQQISYSSSTGWGSWIGLGGTITSDPAVITRGSGEVDVFARSSTGTLVQKSYNNGSWGPWIDLGGNIAGGVGVCARNDNEVLIFARGATLNNLQQISYNSSTGWGSWIGLGGTITSDPTAITRNGGEVDVFARSSTGTLVQKSYNSSWGPWIDLGGNITGGVGVTARDDDEVLVFTRGASLNNLQQKSYVAGEGWGDWIGLGGTISSDPEAFAR